MEKEENNKQQRRRETQKMDEAMHSLTFSPNYFSFCLLLQRICSSGEKKASLADAGVLFSTVTLNKPSHRIPLGPPPTHALQPIIHKTLAALVMFK